MLLLANGIHSLTSAPKKASETSITTTPMVSLTGYVAWALALGVAVGHRFHLTSRVSGLTRCYWHRDTVFARNAQPAGDAPTEW